MNRSRFLPFRVRRTRSLLPLLTLALSLGGCAGSDGSWWGIGLGHAAQAAPEAGDPANAAGSYLVGRAALAEGDFRDAAESFEEALAADPGNPELQSQLFQLLFASGQFDRAVAMAQTMDRKGGAADEAVLLLALDAAHRRDDAKAVALFDRLGNDGVAGPVQPLLDAWAKFAAGDRQQAIDALAATDGNPGLAHLRAFHRAAMLGIDGRPRDGLEALQHAFPDLQQSPMRVVRTALSLQIASGDQAAADKLVAALHDAGPQDPMVQWLDHAAASNDPKLSAVRDPLSGMGDALLSIAEAFFEQERNPEALLLGRAANFVTPEDAESWILIGRISLAQDNPAEAERALAQVPADGPFAWTAELTRARALEDQKRDADAVALLEKMAKDEPARADSLIALGDLLRSEDRFAEAENAYTRALERIPHIQNSDWRLFYARGIAYERTKRWPQAEADLLKALDLEPDQPFVLNYLGYSWVDQGLNLDRAKGMLHRAVDLKPDDGFIVDSLGWAYYRLGEPQKAVTYLERAVELEPGDPVINDHLGDVYWKVGREREARFQWQRALTFKPEADQVPVIQDKLVKGLTGAQPAPG